ncbi:uncharacterized protein [Anoplolepis gracilipes]|uniref:uncharacterized protein isoform X5 n=1 Tax=Anoplolepis gracilipes TaxID=354296 RepID=UPI003B9F0A3F
MITQTKDFAKDTVGDMATYERPSDHHLRTMTRIVGVCTAVVVCGVGADVAYHRHVMGLYVTAASGVIFFLEVTWAITLFVQLCVRKDKLDGRKGLKGPRGTIIESKLSRQDNTEKKKRKASRQLPTRSEVCPSFPRVSRRADEETRITGKHLDNALRCKRRSLYK